MYPRIQVNQWNWPVYLADKLKLHWKETNNHKFAPLPFAIPRATDASWYYSRLPADQRCVEVSWPEQGKVIKWTTS